MVILFLLPIFSIIFLLFSYLYIDFGLTLTLEQTRPILGNFHNFIAFTSANREILSWVFVILILILFLIQIFFLSKWVDKLNIKFLFITAFITTLIFSFSYPFLSSDIFSYIFYSKMVWVYHVNPYVVLPKEFIEEDFWISFVRNIDSTYQYGPIYLFYTLIPMVIFSGSRLIINFFAIKLLNALIFFLSGFLLYKLLNKSKVIFSLWFFNPLLIIELLINSHNELLMISLFFLSLFYLNKKKLLYSAVSFIASILIKYISLIALPLFFLKTGKRRAFLKIICLSMVLFLIFRGSQVWYYTWVYMFLPFINLKNRSLILTYIIGLILILNYTSFLKTNFWGGNPLIPFANIIILGLLIIILQIEQKFLPFKTR